MEGEVEVHGVIEGPAANHLVDVLTGLEGTHYLFDAVDGKDSFFSISRESHRRSKISQFFRLCVSN